MISVPYGLNPISFLAAAMCEDIALLIGPEVSSIASGYCIVKALAAEGMDKKAATIFLNVESSGQANSRKNKFDLLTEDFLNLKINDGGFILSENENGHSNSTEKSGIPKTSANMNNARLETFNVFQNETITGNHSGINSSSGIRDDLKLVNHY
jgi:hypothetical protein